VDERADVYSLGALLYHLLAGQPPVSGRTTAEVLANVLDGKVPELADVQPGIAPDLLAIVAKAMAREPDRRYPSAGELADDLRRFQTGQLVGAHRYSTHELVRRWIRKHRAAIAVAACALAILVTFGAYSVVKIVRAEHVAEEQRAQAVRQSELAEHRRQEAESIVSYMVRDLHAKLATVGRLDALEGAAKTATSYYDDEEVAASAMEVVHRSAARRELGDVLMDQGNPKGALDQYRMSLSLGQALQFLEPSLGASDLAAAHAKIGNALELLGDHEGAAREESTAMDMYAYAPRNQDTKIGRAKAYSDRGHAHFNRGDDAAAESDFRASLALADELTKADPRNASFMSQLAEAHRDISNVLAHRRDIDGLLRELQTALDLARAATEAEPMNASHAEHLAKLQERLGSVLLAIGRPDESAQTLDAARRTLTALAARDATNVEVQLTLTTLDQQLCRNASIARAAVPIRERCNQALDSVDRLATLAPTDMRALALEMSTYDTVGDALDASADASLEPYQHSIAAARRILERGSDTEASSQLALSGAKAASVLAKRGQIAEAIALTDEVLPIAQALVAKEPRTARWHLALKTVRDARADIDRANHDPQHALTELEASLAESEAIMAGRDDAAGLLFTADALDQVGTLQLELRKLDVARDTFTRSLAMMDHGLELAPQLRSNPDLQRDRAGLVKKLAKLAGGRKRARR
jgi:tetratricopeptide (TPR) repeat protein